MQGRDYPKSLINISARADTSQEAPCSIIGSSSHKKRSFLSFFFYFALLQEDLI